MDISDLKLDLSKCKRDLLTGIRECSERGLLYAVKWLAEINFALDHIEPAPEDVPASSGDLGSEFSTYLMAKSYLSLKEYDRCAYFLKNCLTAKARFLHYYARYMAIEKKDMTEMNCPPDPRQTSALKALCTELKNEFYENKLDGYCSYVYGIVLKKMDLHYLAANVFVRAVQEEPLLWSAWYELGKLPSDKSQDINTQLPDHWMKYFYAAHTYLEQLKNDEAVEIYQKLQQLGFQNSTYILSQIALGSHNNRKLQEAIEMFQKILQIDPYRLDNLDTYSNLLYVLENKTDLAHLAHKVVEIDKYRVETCCVIGNYYSLRSDHAKAVLYFKRALNLNPHFLSAWTLMGHEYMEMKNINAAIQSYRYAIEINSRDYRAWYGLGQTYEILKMPFYCLYYYKQAQHLKPNDSRMIIALGETYEKLDKTENALKCYYKACSVGDIEGSGLIKLAKLYDKLNDTENAAAVFIEYCVREEDKKEKVIDEQPEYYNALQYLANYYLRKGQLDDAYTYAYKCIECEERNDLLKDTVRGESARTVLLGQICIIEGFLKEGVLQVRLLKDGATWDSHTFISDSEQVVIPICDKLWPYIASISSPQERVKFARDKVLCEKLRMVDLGTTVGFIDSTDVKLGTVRYKGNIKGLGYGFGLELNEKKPGNKCGGHNAGYQYFQCLPGKGLFTTIEKIIPTYKTSEKEGLPPKPSQVPELDNLMRQNLSNLTNGALEKPAREEIVTKYGEYSKKLSTPAKNTQLNHNLKSSLSLQNILEVEGGTVNTNNDFDQNTIIQPDRSQLMNVEKLKNKSDMDLYDLIGNSWTNGELVKPDTYSSLRKKLDKNDNIKETYNSLSNSNSTLSSNGTLTKSSRNKSMNPLTHLLDNGGTLKKSKFYTDGLENGLDKGGGKTNTKKVENGKKACAFFDRDFNPLPLSVIELNESEPDHQHTLKDRKLIEHHAGKPTAQFYIVEKSKYTDPPVGASNDLVVGSLVEVETDVTDQPLYGVIRWMGLDIENNFILVGIELEEELPADLPLTLTDGTHNGERFFKCSTDRAFFVPLARCRKDPRFQVPTTPVHQAAASDFVECPVIPGAVAPLCMPTEEDVQAVCGKYRGIQGHHNSCYLDVTLFAMFTYTAVFDSLLFRPKNQNDIADYDENQLSFFMIKAVLSLQVQRVLREEIVNPLRKNLYVSADNVMKLRRLLDRLSSVSGLTSEEKDPEEFLNSLLAQILKAEPFLKLNSGQTAFHYQLFVEKDAELTLPTVQQLFEQSFLTSDIKLTEVPSCLIIQMPRFGKNYKMYPRILPSQLLDVTDVIEGSPRQCIVCGKLAIWECKECFAECASTAGLESTAFCTECLKTAHKHERRQRHKPKQLNVGEDFLAMQEQYRPPRLFMELFAVICIETSHYVTFVKCGVGHEAPWCFFDSMADRKGERDGYNIPEMVACPDISLWLSDEALCRQFHEEFPNDRHLPEHARRLLCDAYICMYQSSDVMMYR
ncbi:hypothetical protein YQE_02682, partial [Dendroctonus ponderosae]